MDGFWKKIKMKDHMVNKENTEVDEKITFKKIATKILKLWQSKDANFKRMYMGAGLFFLISCLCVLYLLAVCDWSDLKSLIIIIVYEYLASLTLSTSVAMLIWGFYVNNSCKILNYFKCLFILLLVTISIWEIIIGIPALLFIFAIEKIINRRAKTLENFAKCFFALIIISFFLGLLLTPDLLFSIWAINKICILFVNINVSRCIWFTVITLCVVESFLLCFIFLFIMKFWQTGKKKPQLETSNDRLEKVIKHQENEPDKFAEEKEDSEENNLDVTNKGGREYVWNSIKRIWLLILVCVYAAITFNILNADYIVSNGDDINAVLTIYTLILLYLDKRKQWE